MRLNTRWALLTAAVCLGGTLVACAPSRTTIPEAEISLRKESLSGTTSEPAPRYTDKEPGSAPLSTPAFYGAPPMIPHSIDGMEITASSNDCLDCHETGDEDTPGIPPSHRIKAQVTNEPRKDAREGQVTFVSGFHRVKVVSANRYDCVLCHAPQAENVKPLVGNRFQVVQPAHVTRDALNTLKEEGNF